MTQSTVDDRPVILHLITAFGIGGAERLLASLLPELTNYRHVVLSLRGDGPIRKDFEQAGLTTGVCNMTSLLNIKSFFTFRKYVKKYKPAILNTCLVHADLVGRVWGKICGIPVITSYLVARYRGNRFWLAMRLMRWTDWLVTGYVAVSAEVKRFFVADVRIPVEKLSIILNSVDPKRFSIKSDQYKKQQIFRELNIPEGALIVGTVANLRREKRIDRLVRSLPAVFQECPSAYCIIVGDGVFRPSLEQLANELGVSQKIRFLRFWPDINEVLPLLDVFVLPSAFEGMSIALLEAMAAARPVIVTDTPENREVIIEGTGLLVDTASKKILAESICRLLQQPEQRKRFGLSARQRVEEKFSLSGTLQALDAFFLQFIS